MNLTTWIKPILWPLAPVFLASACAISPIPKSIRAQVAPNITFKQVLEEPDKYKGKTILWGGEILKINNAKEGTTLETLQEPTDSSDKPTRSEDTQGRYIALTKQYLDRAVYKYGRQVTTVGKVEGKKMQPLGKDQMEYSYPLISMDYIYLWPLPMKKVYWEPAFGAYGGPSGYYGGGLGLGWGFGDWGWSPP